MKDVKPRINVAELPALACFSVFLALTMVYYFTGPDIMGSTLRAFRIFGEFGNEFLANAVESPQRTAHGLLLQAVRLLILILWAVGCCGLGKRLMGRFGGLFTSRSQRELFAFGFGFGAVGLLFLALGLMGFLHKWLFITLLILIMAAVRTEMLETASNFGRGIRALWRNRGVERAAVLVFAACFACLFVLCSVPVWDGDGHMYHVSVPEIWLRVNRVMLTPTIMHSNFPFVIEANYGAVMLVMDEYLTKGLNLLMLFSTGFGLIVYGRRFGSRLAGALGAVVWLTLPLTQNYTMIAFNDIGLSFYAFLSVWALIEWVRGRDSRWLALFGAGMGLMLASKLVALFGIVIVLAVFIGFSLFRSDWRRSGYWRWLLIGAGVGLVFCGPWLLKSYVYTGNPVWPFLYDIFGGRYWHRDADQLHYYIYVAQPLMPRAVEWFLGAPWMLTMQGFWLTLDSSFESIGPLFFILLPTVWLARPVSAGPEGDLDARGSVFGVGVIAVLCGLFLLLIYQSIVTGRSYSEGITLIETLMGAVVWLALLRTALSLAPGPAMGRRAANPGAKPILAWFTGLPGRVAAAPHISIPALIFIGFFVFWFQMFMFFRYLLQVLALLIIVLGFVVARSRSDSVRKLSIAVVFVFAFHSMATMVGEVSLLLPQFANQISYAEAIRKSYPDAVGAMADLCGMEPTLEVDFEHVVLLAFETRGGLVKCPYYWSTPDHQGLIDYNRVRDKEAFLDHIGKMGVTHILLNAKSASGQAYASRTAFEVYVTYYEIMNAVRQEALGGESERLMLVYPDRDELLAGPRLERWELYRFDSSKPGPPSREPGAGGDDESEPSL